MPRKRHGKQAKAQPEQQVGTPEVSTEQEASSNDTMDLTEEGTPGQDVTMHTAAAEKNSELEPGAETIKTDEDPEQTESESDTELSEMPVLEPLVLKETAEQEAENKKALEQAATAAVAAVDEVTHKMQQATLETKPARPKANAQAATPNAETPKADAQATDNTNIKKEKKSKKTFKKDPEAAQSAVAADPLAKEREAFIEAKLKSERLEDKSRLANALRMTSQQMQAVEEYVRFVVENKAEQSVCLNSELRLSSAEISAIDEKLTKHEGERKANAEKAAASKNKAVATPEAPKELKADMVREAVLAKFKAFKLQAYKEVLSKEFAERAELEAQSAQVVEKFARDNFTPVSVNRGYFEKDETYIKRNAEAQAKQRLDFIAQHKDTALLDALRAAIRQSPEAMPEGAETLDKEENLQEGLDEFYGKRAKERLQDAEKVRRERSDARYYAPAPVAPKKHISNDAPGLNLSVGRHFGIQWQDKLQKELAKPRVEVELSAAERERRQQLIRDNQAASSAASYENFKATEVNWKRKYTREHNDKFHGTPYEQPRALFTPKPKVKP